MRTYFNYIGPIEMTKKQARAMTHPGPCDADSRKAQTYLPSNGS